MKNLFSAFAITFLMLMSQHVLAQQIVNFHSSIQMSRYDSLKLSQLPALQLSSEASRRLLPAVVDNSLLPFFRPIFSQESFECGQASSIGYVFTYEIDALRNLPANVPENQYSTFFAYNFINFGADETGVSSYETYEVLKHAGCPTASDYGGLSNGGITRWMNGYNLYYNAMHNRVSEVYSIKVNTVEGIQTLKNWLYDHGNGSAQGGLASFYATEMEMSTFPPNIPEAGKHVITWWGNSATHSMTIVGYNDSIRWDYNNDGQYTNNIDLNSDGIIDVRDWEIGGFKMANSYGTEFFGDAGFCYITYKSFADPYGSHGIWNNTVLVVDVKENHEPRLTAKVNLTYGCRNKLRIMTGVATDPTAVEPEYIEHYPVFDFQGGCHPMQGDTSSENIEFGLDLTGLLNHIEPGQTAKYFLLVQENDPSLENTGTINSFSIIDYTNGVTEINSNIPITPIINDNVTSVGVMATINYDDVQITTNSVPEIELYTTFSYPLQAQGGTPPYKWHLVDNYTRHDSTAPMQEINSTKLELSSNYTGTAHITLPFSFPYYGKEYTEVYATSDGYLLFEKTEIPWPYFIEGRTYFIETPMIAPASCSPFFASGVTQGIWYEEGDDFVMFRWRLNVYGASNGIFNATVKLYEDGRIEINYGDCIMPDWIRRFAGISNGDGENYELLSYETDFSPLTNQLVTFIPEANNSGISISNDGILSGQCNRPLNYSPLTVCVSDRNNIRDISTLQITTTGLQMEYTIMAGDDDKIEYGEIVRMNLVVKNHLDNAIGATNFTLSITDSYFTLIDSTHQVNEIQPGESIVINDAFRLQANNDIPNNHQAECNLIASSSSNQYERLIRINAYRPELKFNSVIITDDNNGFPEPGESFQMNIRIRNNGGCSLKEAMAIIQTSNPYLTLFTDNASIDTLASFTNWDMTFDAALAPDTPIGQSIDFTLNITAINDFSYEKLITFRSGIVVENFESNDLSEYGWENDPVNPWIIEEGNAFEGDYCVKSPALGPGKYSSLKMNWNVLAPDSISFYAKTVAYTYNYLKFDLKGSILIRFYGSYNWTRVAFSVPAGETFFRWTFIKTNAPSYEEDCARLDYIVFPPLDGFISAEQLPANTAKLSLYPNPSTDIITIAYTVKDPGPVTINIVDMNGRLIFTSEQNITTAGDYILKPDLGKLRPGMYTVTLQTSKGIVVRKMSKF